MGCSMFPTPTEKHYAIYVDETDVEDLFDEQGRTQGRLDKAISEWDKQSSRIVISGGSQCSYQQGYRTAAECVYDKAVESHSFLDPIEGRPVVVDDATNLKEHVEIAYKIADADGANEVVFVGDEEYTQDVMDHYNAAETDGIGFGTLLVK